MKKLGTEDEVVQCPFENLCSHIGDTDLNVTNEEICKQQP